MKREGPVGRCVSLFVVLACFMACHPKVIPVKDAVVVAGKTFTGPPVFRPDSLVYHLGQIRQGEIKKLDIGFGNEGGEELQIKLISACECTTVDWPVLPVPSGERRIIKVSYDSKEKSGPQIVDLDIMTNAPQLHCFIKLKLEVLP